MKIILGYYILAFILQIILICKGKNSNQNKYWIIFKSVLLAIIVSLPYSYIHFCEILDNNEGTDLSDAIGLIFWVIVMFIAYFLLGIMGLLAEKKSKKKALANSTDLLETKNNNLKYIITFIVTIISFMIILNISDNITRFNNSILNKNIESSVIEYLNNKYGNCDFNIVKVNKNYGYNGITQKYLTGYTVIVNSNSINKSFRVSTGKEYASFSDNFIACYYYDYFNSEENKKNIDNSNKEIIEEIENLNNYLNKYINVLVITPKSLDFNDEEILSKSIPDDYGKIPTINELYKLIADYILRYELELKIDRSEVDDKLHSIEEAEEMLKSLPLNPKYTISNLTVYYNDEIFKIYSSEEELLDKLNEDLKNLENISIPQVKSNLTNYYKIIAKHILDYYSDIQSLELTCYYSNSSGYLGYYKGYIVIDTDNIYINPDWNFANKNLNNALKIKKYQN